MTKDEAIEVLREALKRLAQECELDGLRDIAGYDCWLPEAKKVLAATAKIDVAPTSEAVAVPVWELFADGWDGVDDLDGDWMQTLPIGTKLYYLPSEAVAEKLANEYVSGTVVSDFHGPKVTLRYQTTAAAESAFEALTDAIGGKISAQPAADPAPVPAQGIDHAKRDIYAELMAGFDALDHAKRAEGDLAAFEAWALSDDGNCSRADLMKWSPKDRQAQEGETYCCDLVERDWRVWQARGQQAGVPEGCVIVPNEPTEAMVHAAEDIPPPRLFGKVYRAMIAAAAAPGEAG